MIKKKKRPSGVYSTILSTSLPLNTWPTANYKVKNMSISLDHSSGLDSQYSTWTWAFPKYHDKKILKKKQRRDIDSLLKRFEERYSGFNKDTISWLDDRGFSPISVSVSDLIDNSSGPLSPPSGIITYMDFFNTYNGGNNNNNNNP